MFAVCRAALQGAGFGVGCVTHDFIGAGRVPMAPFAITVRPVGAWEDGEEGEGGTQRQRD